MNSEKSNLKTTKFIGGLLILLSGFWFTLGWSSFFDYILFKVSKKDEEIREKYCVTTSNRLKTKTHVLYRFAC